MFLDGSRQSVHTRMMVGHLIVSGLSISNLGLNLSGMHSSAYMGSFDDVELANESTAVSWAQSKMFSLSKYKLNHSVTQQLKKISTSSESIAKTRKQYFCVFHNQQLFVCVLSGPFHGSFCFTSLLYFLSSLVTVCPDRC